MAAAAAPGAGRFLAVCGAVCLLAAAGAAASRLDDAPAALLYERAAEAAQLGRRASAVNPSDDSVFLHLDAEHIQALVAGLVIVSFWLGALGWDVLSTLGFDYILLRQTRWRSIPSAVHSLAYLLSRYANVAWLVVTATSTITRTDQCTQRARLSAGLFAVGLCSTTLVFLLRTLALWHFQLRVVVPLTVSWLLVVAWSAVIPVQTVIRPLAGGFCDWTLDHLGAVYLFAFVFLFDALALAFTVLKLNRAGWRGLVRGLLPQTGADIRGEDVVSVMLVQRTTAFFVLQYALLISAIVLYTRSRHAAYRLVQIVACQAVSAIMAGRLFRKSWRLTRGKSTAQAYAAPPRYSSASADIGRRDSERPDDGGISEVPLHAAHVRPDDLSKESVYVEGDFPPLFSPGKRLSVRSLGHARDLPTSVDAALESQDSVSVRIERQDGDVDLTQHEKRMTLSRWPGDPTWRIDAPNVVPALDMYGAASPPRTAERRSVTSRSSSNHHASRPCTGDTPPSTSSRSAERRGFAGLAEAFHDSMSRSHDPPAAAPSRVRVRPVTSPSDVRLDIDQPPERSRLCLDLHAYHSQGGEDGSSSLASSAMRGSISSRLSAPLLRNTDSWHESVAGSPIARPRSTRRRPRDAIVDSATSAERRLDEHARWRYAHDDGSSSADGSMRTIRANAGRARSGSDGTAIARHSSRSFLASPAISGGAALGSPRERHTYDLDALRAAAHIPDPAVSPTSQPAALPSSPPVSSSGRIAAHAAQRMSQSPALSSSEGAERSRTRSVAALSRHTRTSFSAFAADDDGDDALHAFRQVIDADAAARAMRPSVWTSASSAAGDDAGRPRTSRGAALGAFGQPRLGTADDADETARPTTSHSRGARRSPRASVPEADFETPFLHEVPALPSQPATLPDADAAAQPESFIAEQFERLAAAAARPSAEFGMRLDSLSPPPSPEMARSPSLASSHDLHMR